MYIFHKFINYTNIFAPDFFLTTNSLSWEDTALTKLIKERVLQFILTFLDEEHSLFSSGVGVILGVSYLTPALACRVWFSKHFIQHEDFAMKIFHVHSFSLKFC